MAGVHVELEVFSPKHKELCFLTKGGLEWALSRDCLSVQTCAPLRIPGYGVRTVTAVDRNLGHSGLDVRDLTRLTDRRIRSDRSDLVVPR